MSCFLIILLFELTSNDFFSQMLENFQKKNFSMGHFFDINLGRDLCLEIFRSIRNIKNECNMNFGVITKKFAADR